MFHFRGLYLFRCFIYNIKNTIKIKNCFGQIDLTKLYKISVRNYLYFDNLFQCVFSDLELCQLYNITVNQDRINA